MFIYFTGSPLLNTLIKNTTDAPTTEMSLSARLKGIVRCILCLIIHFDLIKTVYYYLQ